MSKNNKNKNKHSKSTTLNKNVKEQPPEFLEKIKLALDQHVLFWLIVFPPVAIYKLIKHKIIGKVATTFLILFLVIILGYCIFMVMNPNFVTNTNLKTTMEKLDYGDVRDVEHLGIYNDLHVSEVITTKGFYAVYYDYSDNNDLFINTIIELHTEIKDDIVYNGFVVKYKSEKSDELLSQINPAAIKFLIKNSDYGNIEAVIESSDGTQVFQTSKGQYKFKYHYYDTVNIKKLNNNGEWEDVMNRDYVIEMKDEFKQVLNKKDVIPFYYEIKTITSYGINEKEIYYTFENFCGNQYRVVKHNDGRITLEHSSNIDPVAQEDLAEAWENYQKGLLENVE